MKRYSMLLVVALFALGTSPVWAQGGVVTSGCTNSPENPTALLAVVGTAGGFFSYVRARRRARRSK